MNPYGSHFLGFIKPIYSRTRSLIFLIALLSSWAFVPLFLVPSGLTDVQPVGKFLNGAFPEEVPSGDYILEPAFPNLTFESPLTWAVHPNDNKIFVGQRDGQVFYFTEDENVSTKTSFIDLSSQVGVVWDGGFLGFAFHPNFGKSGATGRNYFFVYYSTKDQTGANSSPTPQRCPEDALFDGAYLVLQRYEVFEGTLTVDQSKTIDMFKVRLYNSTHRGGGMVFGKDGLLYLTTGDQAQHSVAQNMSTNLDGGVLRFDVDMDPTRSHPPTYVMPKDLPRGADETSGNGYYIPNDNPFVGQPNIFEEYYTLGHRNPHRMTMDRLTGTMYIGEIGSSKHEEVNVVAAGKNYGWPVWEGAQAHNRCTDQLYPGTTHTLPLVAFPRSEANSITGGYVYRGGAMPSLYGRYICGDYGSGDEIWSVDTQTGAYELIMTTDNPISFGEDKAGELYVLRLGSNKQLLRIRQEGVNFNPPQLLSQTGAFSNLATLTPADGVVPYGMYESFWSDGAEKQRWIAIPQDGNPDSPEEQINYSENGEWTFPEGTVFIKHFEMPMDESNSNIRKRLETRFTIRAKNGNVYGITYKWRADGSDADLLDDSLDEPLTINTPSGPRTQVWHYPSRSECLTCHNDAVNGTLGLRTRYLNNDFTYPRTGATANQLVTLSHLGFIPTSITDGQTANLPSNASQKDPSASLEKRARSYLDLNCSYCHRPGTDNRGIFDTRIQTPLYLSNLFSDNLNQSLNIPGEKVIAPGDISKSVLYQRIHSVDPSIMMPPLAKSRIDTEGAALIAEWIESLDPNNLFTCDPSNVALGKAASQSSTYPGTLDFEPGNAVDGDRTGTNSSGSISHTLQDPNSWWEVDLGDLYSINQVKIWNRTDCCADRLNNFYVIASETPFTSEELAATLVQPGVEVYHFTGVAGRETDISLVADARYLRIQLGYANGYLQLAEVEVMGCLQLPENPCTASGEILMERWNNIGTSLEVSSIPVGSPPTATSMLNSFEIPVNAFDEYGVRVRGYFCAPQTGNYTFWISSDDKGELWLSSDDNPANKQRIAYVPGWTSSRLWDKYPEQQSAPVYLRVGETYYVEALMKENGGGDNLAVGWQLPDGSLERPIGGNVLSPYVEPDTEAPSIPQNLTASNIGQTELDLNWNASSDNVEVVGYYLYQDGDPNPIGTVSATSFTVSGLAPGSTHQFAIAAFDAQGNVSAQSQAVQVTLEAAGACSTPSNIALSRPARQSTTYGFGLADLAVDGNLEGNSPWSANLQHSQRELQPWWEVDLGASSQIDAVRIINRDDCCQMRLADFYILISDQPMEGSLEQLLASSAVSSYYQPGENGAVSQIPIDTEGQYVRIQLNGNNILHMAEVEVIGCTLEQVCEVPAVSIAEAGPFEQGEPPVQLSAEPAGGTWSGPIGSDGLFNPSLGAGTYEVTYTYEVFTGCVGSDTQEIVVLPAGSSCESPTNLALNKVASQSSTYGIGEAGLAFDGNTTGTSAWSADLQHTTNEVQPWLQVDLGQQSRLEAVNLFNRSDATFNRLKDFYVLVSDVPFSNTASLDALLQNGGIESTFFSGVAGAQESILMGGSTGRYVRVQLSGRGIIHVAEVEVMGCVETGGCIDPVVSIDPAGPFAADAGLQQLQASPSGGVWSGAANSAGMFDPSQGPGTYEVIYSYTDLNGCSNSATQQVEVFPGGSTCNSLVNLAFNQSASMSSTYGIGGADLAVDGNTSGSSPWSADLTHSQNENQPWWQVDLGAESQVEQIKIFNRTDCCMGRLKDFYILTSRVPFSTSASLTELLSDPNVSQTFISGAAGLESLYFLQSDARYVRIQLSNPGILQLAEVEVWGCEGANSMNRFAVSAEEVPIYTSPKLIVYPNPASQLAQIQVNRVAPDAQLTYSLFALTGQRVWGKIGGPSEQIQVKGLAKGIYLLRVEGTDWQEVIQFMVQ